MKDKVKKIKFIVVIIIVYIGVPLLFYIFIDRINLIPSKIKSSDWLSAWVTYMAGTLGGLATLLAMKITVKNSYNQLVEEQKNRENEIKEERKYQYSPYLSVRVLSDKEVNKYDHITEISRCVFLPGVVQDNTCKEEVLYLEIENNGFGPATNIYMFYDGSYIINGVNSHSQKDFLLKECLNIGKERKVVCKLRLNINEDLVKKRGMFSEVMTVDFLHQDILGNIIRKRICLSLHKKYIYSEQNLEYLSTNKIKGEYPNIDGIERLFATGIEITN